MAPWLSSFIQIVLIAVGILCVQLLLIIVGSRRGWFLWIGKRIMAIIRRMS